MAAVLMGSDVAITDPCVVFALRRESMAFRRAHAYQQRFRGAPCRAQFRGTSSQTVLMLETGLGAAAMESAVRWCLRGPCFGSLPYRPRLVLSAGFSGALRPEQRVGDLILATEIADSDGNCWKIESLDRLSEGEGIARGRLLTVAELVSDPCDKQRLGEQYQALAVDMESVIAARLCAEHGVPFVCLRVISDDLHTPLSSRLVDVLRNGRVSPWRLSGAVLRQPRLIGELMRLAGQTRRAAGRLLAVRSLLSAHGR